MSLDTARAVATLRSLTKTFDETVQAAEPFYPTLATVVPSEGYDEEYGMLGSVPGVREWLGDRQMATLRGAKFTIANKEWETSVQIERNDIEDARLLKYGPIMGQLGDEAAYHPDELLFSLLIAGSAGVCFDGQYFYDTDHVWGDSGSQSNLLTYNGSSPVTAADFLAAFHQAREAMINFKRDNGKFFMRPTVQGLNGKLLVVVPTELELVAHKAFDSQLTGGGDTNVVLDKPRIVCSPYLTSAVKFHLYYLGGVLKPYIFQARRPLSRQMKGLEDREFKAVKFMADARYNVGYGAWWTAVETEFN